MAPNQTGNNSLRVLVLYRSGTCATSSAVKSRTFNIAFFIFRRIKNIFCLLVGKPACKEERELNSDEKRKLCKAKAYVISLLGDFLGTSQAKQVNELGCKINMIPRDVPAFLLYSGLGQFVWCVKPLDPCLFLVYYYYQY
jgi:hypothetical protein